MNEKTWNQSELVILGGLIALLVLVRLFHLSPHIDEPHSWRQCDTAFYILDFYENGIDLLHPGVCWMGGHKTVILEFPLPEAIVAVLYNIFGPNLIWARLVFLLFFLGSAWYFFRMLEMVYGKKMAAFSVVVYLGLPLAMYYSRAIHVDFTAMFFALGGSFYLMNGVKEDRIGHILVSVGLFTLGFLIKAPYVFFLALPLGFYLYSIGKIKKALTYLPLFAIPVLAFWGWRAHTFAVNSAAPDWEFIPGYIKMVEMGGWYFGEISQRLSSYQWGVLGDRLLNEWAGWGALAFFLVGMFIPTPTQGKRITFLWLWALGAFIYLLIFFNLNVRHDYYQIPFLPVIAAFAGHLLSKIHHRFENVTLWKWMAMGLLVVISAVNLYFTETGNRYYWVNGLFVEAGKYVQEETSKEDLIILAAPMMDPRSPFWMYRARRTGWTMNSKSITPEVVTRLQAEGADHLAFLVKGPVPKQMREFVKAFRENKFDIEAREGFNVYLYHLE